VGTSEGRKPLRSPGGRVLSARLSECPCTSACAPTNELECVHSCVCKPPGAPPARAHLVQGGDEANALVLLPAPCQALAQEVPIVLALPEEAPLLLHVKLAETRAWTCSFGGVPCSPLACPLWGWDPASFPSRVGPGVPWLSPLRWLCASVSLLQHVQLHTWMCVSPVRLLAWLGMPRAGQHRLALPHPPNRLSWGPLRSQLRPRGK